MSFIETLWCHLVTSYRQDQHHNHKGKKKEKFDYSQNICHWLFVSVARKEFFFSQLKEVFVNMNTGDEWFTYPTREMIFIPPGFLTFEYWEDKN